MVITSPRLKNASQSVITLRVMGMNLQGTGRFKGFFFSKQEIYTTVFVLEISFGRFKWTTRKLFDECRQFLLTAQPFKEEEFQSVFPREIDVEDDVFVLVERKESMEKFLEGVVATMDFLVYKPLFYFLNSNDEIRPLVKKINRLQSTIRMFLSNRKLNQTLAKKYESDIQKFLKLLSEGIRVAVLSQDSTQFEPVKKVLWLIRNSSEPGLSRLCCTTYAEFFAYTGSEDEDGDVTKPSGAQHPIHDLELESDSDDDMWGGKYEGIYLSDIAEIRKGPSSYRFGQFIRNLSHSSTPQPEKSNSMTDRTDSPDEDPNDELVESKVSLLDSDCIVIVGSERVLDLQFLPESLQGLYGLTGEEDADDVEMLRSYARDWFVDILSLLSIRSLSTAELLLRSRTWNKCLSEDMESEMRSILIKKKLGTARTLEAEIFREVLVGSIQVDEEVCDRRNILRRSPTQFNIELKAMWYDPPTNRFYIQRIDDGFFQSESSQIRGLDIDDIAEIRPGRISFACDGTDFLPSLTIVGTETSISLPLDSVAIRNALLRQFQSFLRVYRNPDRSAYVPTQLAANLIESLNKLITDPTSKEKAELKHQYSLESEIPTPDQIQSPSLLSSKFFTPNHVMSSGKPTRRKSTPASLNKGYSHSNDSLWVRANPHQVAPHEASPSKPLAGSVPKDFFSPTRHSASATLRASSTSISISSPASLKKVFSEAASPNTKQTDLTGEDAQDDKSVKNRFDSVEKSGLVMALEFEDEA